MAITTALTKQLGLRHPIIQAPMGGGGSTVGMAAEVCEAGGLGCLAAAYLTPAQIHTEAQKLRAATSKPFGINLFVPQPAPKCGDARRALAALAPLHAELGLPPPEAPQSAGDDFGAKLAAVLDSGARVFSFTFGIMPEAALAAARERGMMLVGTATTVEEGLELQRAGVDGVVAQGAEAGAHRGSFAQPFAAAMIGTIALVPQMTEALSIPVIASGGIMEGRGIAAALALGACAVQLGTAFLTTDEAGIPVAYKEAILAAGEHETQITTGFSGRPARGIRNRAMAELEGAGDGILPFPFQNTLTRALRAEAARQGRAEFLSLWAGQGVRLARREPAAALVARLAEEAEAAIARLERLRS